MEKEEGRAPRGLPPILETLHHEALIGSVTVPLREQTLSPCCVPATVLGAGSAAFTMGRNPDRASKPWLHGSGRRGSAPWRKPCLRFVLRAKGWAQIFEEKERGDDLPGRRETAWAKATESQLEEVQEVPCGWGRGAERWGERTHCLGSPLQGQSLPLPEHPSHTTRDSCA